LNLGFQNKREADDTSILEALPKNSERNPTKSKAEIVYNNAYNL
jgi:hypothetical protein